jgi:very-short-patch-repair endonuclease
MLYARDGVQTLGLSLRGAAGSEAISRNLPETARAMTHTLDDAVYEAFAAQGLTLHRHVGASNYRIDLAVVDPAQPGRYLLGIECDGAMYAAAATARERDRLRLQVLEQLGWKMHRIWSHDWISNQAAEVAKVMARLQEPADSAATALPAAGAAVSTAAASTGQTMAAESFLAETQTPEALKDLPTFVWPYIYAKLPAHPGAHTGTLSQAVPHDLVGDVIKVVGTEGPVHVDVVCARIGAAWKVSRLTAKAKQLIGAAIDMAVHAQRIERRGDFLWPMGLATPVVRAPKEGDKARSIEHIAPEEIAEASFLVTQEARSLSETDLIAQTARLLGYARVTKKIDAAVTQALEDLKASGRLREEEGFIRVG